MKKKKDSASSLKSDKIIPIEPGSITDPDEKEKVEISIDEAEEEEKDDDPKPRFSDDGDDPASEYWDNDEKNWGEDEEDAAWGGVAEEEQA